VQSSAQRLMLEVDRRENQVRRAMEPELLQSLPFPGLGSGVVDLEDAQPIQQIRAPESKRIEPGAQDDVLPDARFHRLLDDVLGHPCADADPAAEAEKLRGGQR